MLLRSTFCAVQSWNNNGKYMTKNLMFISTDKTFHFVWLPESIGKVRVYSIAFQTLWKENSLRTPLPFGNLPLSDPPTPRNFCDPPWGGYEYFLEPHIDYTDSLSVPGSHYMSILSTAGLNEPTFPSIFTLFATFVLLPSIESTSTYLMAG